MRAFFPLAILFVLLSAPASAGVFVAISFDVDDLEGHAYASADHSEEQYETTRQQDSCVHVSQEGYVAAKSDCIRDGGG